MMRATERRAGIVRSCPLAWLMAEIGNEMDATEPALIARRGRWRDTRRRHYT